MLLLPIENFHGRCIILSLFFLPACCLHTQSSYGIVSDVIPNSQFAVPNLFSRLSIGQISYRKTKLPPPELNPAFLLLLKFLQKLCIFLPNLSQIFLCLFITILSHSNHILQLSTIKLLTDLFHHSHVMLVLFQVLRSYVPSFAKSQQHFLHFRNHIDFLLNNSTAWSPCIGIKSWSIFHLLQTNNIRFTHKYNIVHTC